MHAAGVEVALDRGQCDALVDIRLGRSGGEFARALVNGGVEFGIRDHLVDEAPFLRPLAAHPLFDRAEDIGAVAAHAAFIGYAGQPAGARQHRQQRHLRQRHRRGAVVGQHDVVARQRQLIPAAGTGASNGADVFLARVVLGRLIGVAGLVGELAEIHLVAVLGPAQHADVGARTEHPVLA